MPWNILRVLASGEDKKWWTKPLLPLLMPPFGSNSRPISHGQKTTAKRWRYKSGSAIKEIKYLLATEPETLGSNAGTDWLLGLRLWPHRLIGPKFPFLLAGIWKWRLLFFKFCSLRATMIYWQLLQLIESSNNLHEKNSKENFVTFYNYAAFHAIFTNIQLRMHRLTKPHVCHFSRKLFICSVSPRPTQNDS